MPRTADALRAGADLGAYAPLIGAVRDELEHFVASHVRLHVVIAERDRFMLTSIGVRSPGGRRRRATCCASSCANSGPSRSSAISPAK
jgi:hypothetical protein